MSKPVTRAAGVLALLALALAPAMAGCASSSPAWVVESVGYSGPRGENGPGESGVHSVTCIPASAADEGYGESDRWRQVKIPDRAAYSARWNTGKPCPDGPVLAQFPDPDSGGSFAEGWPMILVAVGVFGVLMAGLYGLLPTASERAKRNEEQE